MTGPRPGPTGEFPEGHLTDEDEGELVVRVGTHKGRVVVEFGVPTRWFAMGPLQAHELAAALVTKVNELDIDGGEG